MSTATALERNLWEIVACVAPSLVTVPACSNEKENGALCTDHGTAGSLLVPGKAVRRV